MNKFFNKGDHVTNATVESAEDPILPEGARRRLSLEPIRPLLTYLDKLEQNCKERPLTWVEDTQAVFILKGLVPADDTDTKECTESFCEPQFRRRRTLCQWYIYARHFAKHLAGECH